MTAGGATLWMRLPRWALWMCGRLPGASLAIWVVNMCNAPRIWLSRSTCTCWTNAIASCRLPPSSRKKRYHLLGAVSVQSEFESRNHCTRNNLLEVGQVMWQNGWDGAFAPSLRPLQMLAAPSASANACRDICFPAVYVTIQSSTRVAFVLGFDLCLRCGGVPVDVRWAHVLQVF